MASMENKYMIAIMSKEYSLKQLGRDLIWSKKEDKERQKWHEARHKEMLSKQNVNWNNLNLTVLKTVFRPYYDSYPLSKLIKKEIINGEKVLEIGTGSGNLAVLIALQNPKNKIVAIDSNYKSIENVKLNAKKYNVQEQIIPLYSSLFSNSKILRYASFDVIIVNLPFVDRKTKNNIQRSIFDENLTSYKKLFRKANKLLKKDGKILLAYSNFASFKNLIKIAEKYGYRCAITHIKKMKEIKNRKHRLGLQKDIDIFSERKNDRRIFYALKFKNKLKISCIVSPYYISEFEPNLNSLAKKYKAVLNQLSVKGDTPQEKMSVIYKNLAKKIYESIQKEKIPLSVAGDCISCIGVLAGLQRANIHPSIIWLDAHGDFHTWKTTTSNFLGGMPLAMITGRGEQTMVNKIGLKPLEDNKIYLLNARDLEKSERYAIKKSKINYIPDISKFKIPKGPLHVHLDVDILSPEYVPAVDYPAKKGLLPENIKNLFLKIAFEGNIVAISVSSWNAKKDDKGKSEKITFDLLRTLTG